MALDQDECELAGAGYSSVADLRVLDDIFEGRGLYFQPAEIENETLHPGHHISNSRVHVVLLNWQLLPGDRLLKLLRAATSITCVDGGALRLLDRLWEYDLPTIADVFYLQGTETKKELRIIGDMDSINEHHERRWDSITGQEKSSLKTLIKFGFKVIQIVDDYSTDFEKARRNLEETGVIQEGDIVLVDGALGGRFDQQMSHLAILYRAKYPAEVNTHMETHTHENTHTYTSKHRHSHTHTERHELYTLLGADITGEICDAEIKNQLPHNLDRRGKFLNFA